MDQNLSNPTIQQKEVIRKEKKEKKEEREATGIDQRTLQESERVAGRLQQGGKSGWWEAIAMAG